MWSYHYHFVMVVCVMIVYHFVMIVCCYDCMWSYGYTECSVSAPQYEERLCVFPPPYPAPSLARTHTRRHRHRLTHTHTHIQSEVSLRGSHRGRVSMFSTNPPPPPPPLPPHIAFQRPFCRPARARSRCVCQCVCV